MPKLQQLMPIFFIIILIPMYNDGPHNQIPAQHSDAHTVSFAHRKRVLFERRFCKQFKPYSQFLMQQPWAYLHHPHPQFIDKNRYSLRNNLIMQKQIMYARNSLNCDFNEQIIKEYLSEECGEMIKNRRNTSLILQGMLYYCHKSKLMRANITNALSKETINNRQWRAINRVQTETILNVDGQIYELFQINNCIGLRLVRTLLIYDIVQMQIRSAFKFDYELINISCASTTALNNSTQSIVASTYERDITSFYLIDLATNTIVKIGDIPDLVNAHCNITQNQLIISQSHSISMYDIRANAVSTLHSHQQTASNRIFSILPLGAPSQHLASTQSFSICIYDIRKPNHSIIDMKHYCEEAPPSILQYHEVGHNHSPSSFESLLQLYSQPKKMQEKPILIAHSASFMGSSIFTDIDLHVNTKIDKYQKSNRFQLLFDSGKVSEGCSPQSISCSSIDNILCFFHVDTFGGIAVEMFEHKEMEANTKTPKASNYEFSYERINGLCDDGLRKQMDFNYEWWKESYVNRYCRQQAESKIDEQVDEDLQLQEVNTEERRVRFAKLDEFYKHLYNKSKLINFNHEVQIQNEQTANQLQSDKQKENDFKPTIDNTQSIPIQQMEEDPTQKQCTAALINRLANLWEQ